jgi:hypothetical protein
LGIRYLLRVFVSWWLKKPLTLIGLRVDAFAAVVASLF